MSGQATSPDGLVRVVADEGGVPEQVVLGSAALRLGEPALARELLARCQEAGARARIARAARLQARGIPDRVVTELGLAAPDLPDADPGEPASWFR